MHPKILLLALLSLALTAFLSAQRTHGKVIYGVEPDSVSLNELLKDFKKDYPNDYTDMVRDFTQSFEIAKDMKIELQFNETEGLSFLVEDIALKEQDPYIYDMATDYTIRSNERFYANTATRKTIREASNDGGVSFIHVLEEEDKYLWEFHNETKQIGKYQCRKATASYESSSSCCGTHLIQITAWYAPALPYPFGPKDFHSLPGLVLEVQTAIDGENGDTIQAESIQIDTESKKKIPSLNKPSRVITQEQLNKEAEELLRAIRRN